MELKLIRSPCSCSQLNRRSTRGRGSIGSFLGGTLVAHLQVANTIFCLEESEYRIICIDSSRRHIHNTASKI